MEGAFHSLALYKEIFKKGNTDISGCSAFIKSPDLARQLSNDIHQPICRIIKTQKDIATKFASELGDGNIIESVIIPAKNRNTLCVSSQAGCKWGCAFCATGDRGFKRNLSTEEIVWQVFEAQFILKKNIDNIVFMGMGEPLDNLDNVIRAINVIGDQHGFDISQSHITVSTAGQCDGIRKLAQLNLRKLHLAISLNSADNEMRSKLMPINRTYPLSQLKKELSAFPLGKKGIFFMEYVLLNGINDSKADAEKLASFCNGLPVRINLIPYNAGSHTSFKSPSTEHITRFAKWLTDEKMFVRIRGSYGNSISAACGQLGASLVK
jgi:23S rRNA (adenine2503-C2)-methyltransferase